MLRTSSPLRLGLLRALAVGAALAFPVAFLATGVRGLQPWHVGWFVLCAHAALGVAAASWLERHAATGAGRPPGATALLAGALAAGTRLVGMLQAVYASHAHLGGATAGLATVEAWLVEAALSAIAGPVVFGAYAGLGLLGVVAGWGVPLGAFILERLRPNLPWNLLLGWAFVTLGAVIPAHVLLFMAYQGAEVVDDWIGDGPSTAS